MATIFSRIVAGEIPSHKVAEDDEFFAFLDIKDIIDLLLGNYQGMPQEGGRLYL